VKNGTKYVITDSLGSVSFVITAFNDTLQQMSGEFNVILVNEGNSFDILGLLNGVFTDLPFTVEEFSTGTMSLSANGTPVTFSTVLGFSIFGSLAITGATSSGFPAISMTMSETIAPGTYPLGVASAESISYQTDQNTIYVASSGNLVISSNANGNIQGTFSFTGTGAPGTISITNGTFDVDYQ
jgi:hypothetical protein